MAKRLTDDELRRTIEAVEATGSQVAAARVLRVTKQCVTQRLARAEARGLCVVVKRDAAKRLREQLDARPHPGPLPEGEGAKESPTVLRRNPRDVAQRLFDEHLAWAEQCGVQFAGTLPQSVIVDDMVQAARLGLWEAAQRFDEARGLKFKTYAVPAIQGRMRDELRVHDPISRATRKLVMARRAAEEALGPQATREAVQERLGWTDEQYVQSLSAPPASLELEIYESDSGKRVEVIDTLAADEEAPPIDRLATVAELLRGLAPDEFVVIYLYHWKSQRMRDIGAVLELSESRVSQLHSEICERLRRSGKEQFLERAA